MSRFSFCNINREHDSVTSYIRLEFRSKLNGSLKQAVIQMLFCRIFNEPETLKLACPLKDFSAAKAAIKSRSEAGNKIFRGAYIMPSHEKKGYGALDYWFRALHDADKLDFSGVSKLARVSELLMTVKGLGEFISNQVCADLRYVNGLEFSDWGDFILCGPGTKRGLNRVSGRDHSDHMRSDLAVGELLSLREVLSSELNQREAGHFKDPNNVANSLCEFDKYERFSQDPGSARLKTYGRNKNRQVNLI